jgi:phospholipid-binding lipoprotein MlaA
MNRRLCRGAGCRALLSLVILLALTAAARGQDVLDDPSINDPWEPLNRKIFVFNDTVDRFVLRPVAKSYDTVTPKFAQRGVGNFLANLYDVNGALNAMLQGRPVKSLQNLGRFAINTTVGMLGFIDIATPAGLPRYRTDFGHTLARWGVGDGPFVMVPFLGPRNVRTGIGQAFDVVFSVQYAMESNRLRNALFAVEIVHARAGLLDAEQLMTGDRYVFMRDAYLQQRAVQEADGVIEDAFSDFEDEDW